MSKRCLVEDELNAPEKQMSFKARSLEPDEEQEQFDVGKGGGKALGRTLTDSACLFIFVGYMIGMLYILYIGVEQGEMAKLTHGYDWNGTVCSLDYNEKKPFIYWCAKQDLAGVSGVPWVLYDPICVSECPTSTKTTNRCPGKPVLKPFSVTDGTTTISGMNITRTTEPVPDMPTKPVMKYYCLPSESDASEVVDLIFGEGSMTNAFKTGTMVMEAIVDAKYFLLGFLILATALGYLYLYAMGMLLKPLIILTFAVVDLALLGGGIYFTMLALPQIDVKDFMGPVFGVNATTVSWICAGILYVLFVLFSIYWAFAMRGIDLTVQSVRSTFTILRKMPTLLAAPFCQIVCQLVTTVIMFAGMLVVMSLGEVVTPNYMVKALENDQSPSAAGIYREFTFTDTQKLMLVIWVFGFLWCYEMCKAWCQFAVANAVVEMEIMSQTSCLPLSRGYLKGFKWHLGTIAFGAFIMGMVDMCSLAVQLILSQLKNEDGTPNKFVKVAQCCCACFFKCLKTIVECTNQLVYADCVMYGTHYLKAASNVMQTFLQNPVTVTTVIGATKYIKLGGMLFISVVGTLLSYFVSKNFNGSFTEGMAGLGDNPGIKDFASNISSPYAASVLGVTVAGSFISCCVAQAFMTVFDMLTDTVAYCKMQKEGEQGEYKTLPGK